MTTRSTLTTRSLRAESLADEPTQPGGEPGLGGEQRGRGLTFIPEYRVYNRERELERLERERKEHLWEEELNTAMSQAEPPLEPRLR